MIFSGCDCTEGIDCYGRYIFGFERTKLTQHSYYVYKYTHILYKQLQTPYRLLCTVYTEYRSCMITSQEEVHFPEEVMTVTTPILLVPSRFPQWRVSGLLLEVWVEGFIAICVYVLNNVYVDQLLLVANLPF